MDNVTLGIAAIASLLVLFLRPTRAFAVYIAVLLFYPTYLVVSIGVVDISASRIVIAVLLVKFLTNKKLRGRFKWCQLDGWVAFYMGVTIVIMCITQSPMKALENRAGFLMDTFFAYLAIRFCITDRKALISVVKCVGVILVPLVILGVLESAADWRPYAQLRQYCPWRTETTIKAGRFGFERAEGSFGQAIMFGAAFVLFLPLIYSLRHEKNWQTLAYILSGAAIMGSLSSASGGPVMMVIVAVFCMILERHKHWVKPLLILFVISCIGIGIISNRPFYHVVVSYANPIGGAGWHRCKLIDCAITSFGEWFLLGYKGQDPGWGPSMGMAFADITNQFLLTGVRFGMLGIIALVAILISGFRGLILTYRSGMDRELQSYCWALGATLVCLIVGWMSVSFFGQTANLTYCVLGIIGSVSTWRTGKLKLQTNRISRTV